MPTTASYLTSSPTTDAEKIQAWIEGIDDPEHRERVEDIFKWSIESYPNLVILWKWNMPMFTDHGTFIMSFSASAKHIGMGVETFTLDAFTERIENEGYGRTKKMWQIPWSKPVPYELLGAMIEHTMEDKADCTTFWRR